MKYSPLLRGYSYGAHNLVKWANEGGEKGRISVRQFAIDHYTKSEDVDEFCVGYYIGAGRLDDAQALLAQALPETLARLGLPDAR